MTFERTTDADLIHEIVTHPANYFRVIDDSAPEPSVWRPVMNDAVWYVVIKDAEEILGLWAFFPENAVTWRAHMNFLPAAYGPRARQATRELFRWIWENTSCRRIIGEIPGFNRLAMRLVQDAGMRPFGIDEASFLKNGKLEDRVAFGISA
jgi:RimJ/RimL family protein N-acetyltransferase